MANPILYRYSDVVFGFLAPYDTLYEHKIPVHVVTYVVSGEIIVEDGETTTRVQAGESIFVKRNQRVKLTKRTIGNEPYAAISVRLERSFLKHYFSNMDKSVLPERPKRLHCAAIRLEQSPEFDAMSRTLMPFIEDTSIKPDEVFLIGKMRETIEILLHMNERFYPTLFDFNESWKIDLMEFMEENYMLHLTLGEFASYSGRSLATFKRDFSKVNDITPQRWLTSKRLEKAYYLLKKGGKTVSDVCLEVGFINRTHFIAAFKKQYGISPQGMLTRGLV